MMEGMKEIKRVSAGVMFESDVLKFINSLASANQRNRSFIINQIVRHYARMMQQPNPSHQVTGNQEPEQTKPAPVINF